MLKETTLKLGRSLLFNYFIGDLISLILVLAIASVSKSSIMNVVVTIVCTAIVLVMIYNAAWDEGFRDPNRVNYNHMKKCPLKGLYAGLFADIPLIFMYLAVAFTNLAQWHYHVSVAVFELANMYLFYLFQALRSNPYILFIFCIPVPAVAAAGYLIGYKRISISNRILFKGKAPESKKTKYLIR